MSEINNEISNNIMKILELFLDLIVLLLGWINRKKIALWFQKLKLKFFPINFNVAFSLDFKEGLNSGNYFEQIKKDLNNVIDDIGLIKQITIHDFSEIQKFKNKEEAECFLEKKKLDLIIWGEFTNDTLKKDGVNINKLNLKFTFGSPSSKNNIIGKMMSIDIQSKIAKKNYWEIIDNNSYTDIQIVSNNILDISTYIVALVLKISGRIGESLKIFEALYKKLLDKNDDFHKDIIPHLFNCYEILILENIHNRKNFNFTKTLSLKILDIDSQNFFAINSLAIAECRLGNINETEKLIEKLLQLYPRHPITDVNVAYVRIFQKNFNNALKHYKHLKTLKDVPFKPQEVIEFLGSDYDKTKEPALLFGIGVVSMFWDKVLSKKSLKEFIRKADKNLYKNMISEAKKILKM